MLDYKATKRNPRWQQITEFIDENDIQRYNQLKGSTLVNTSVGSLEPWKKQIE